MDVWCGAFLYSALAPSSRLTPFLTSTARVTFRVPPGALSLSQHINQLQRQFYVRKLTNLEDIW